jgi:hypothetical protein
VTFDVKLQFRTIARNHFVPYEFCTITISYHNLPFRTTKLQFNSHTKQVISYHNHFVNTYGTKWFLVMVRNCNFVVRNGYGAKYIWNEIAILWYEMVNYGTKWLWCKIHMVRKRERNITTGLFGLKGVSTVRGVGHRSKSFRTITISYHCHFVP